MYGYGVREEMELKVKVNVQIELISKHNNSVNFVGTAYACTRTCRRTEL